MVKAVSDLAKSLKTATAGMTVQTKRMLVISENLANASTKPSEPGELPYRRKTVVLGNQRHGDVDLVSIKSYGVDKSPFKQVYDPGDPVADENGMVQMPNVTPMVEMMDMRDAGLSHEANLRAYEKTLRMMEETIGILRG